MRKLMSFEYPRCGEGRPQVILIGNGLERKSGQLSWERLLDQLTVKDSLPITKEQRELIPFPLLYQLLSTQISLLPKLNHEAIQAEEQRLKSAMGQMVHQSNELLNILPSLEADQILTTNYSYCIEKAFFPLADFSKSSVRSLRRFRLGGNERTKRVKREINYKLHTGYLAKSMTRDTGIWHIHGECSASRGIILGHDRYGRLLRHIQEVLDQQEYSVQARNQPTKKFTSWPELFLYGDIYILGLALGESEFDLWWLLRRKQRESYSDGKVFFYEQQPENNAQERKHLLLRGLGVTICTLDWLYDTNYDAFYIAALSDIRKKIATSRLKL